MTARHVHAKMDGLEFLRNVMDVLIPTKLDHDTLDDLFVQLDAARDLDNVRVDFSRLGYSRPTAMLVAGSKLREWIDYRNSCGYESNRYGIDQGVDAHSYLMHLGFFDFVHMDEGNRIGQARGSLRYLPITRIKRPDVDINNAGVEPWYAEIEQEARRIGGVLAGSYDDSQELRTYTYSVREIIRNVFEHSQVDECFVCGQRWYSGQVEIAIIDEGVGIGRTLADSHQVEFDEDALRLAVQPGISRTSGFSTRENIYDNSGFGLYVLSELAASFGWFALGSGSARLVGYKNARKIEPSSFRGTFFGMRLHNIPRDFASVLKDIIDVGEDEARVAGTHVRASGRSRFVTF